MCLEGVAVVQRNSRGLVRSFIRKNGQAPNKDIALFVCEQMGWNCVDVELVG